MLITSRVLTEEELDIQVNIDSQRNRLNMQSQMNKTIDLIGLSTRSNQISTGLNTNYVFGVNFYPEINYHGWLIQFTKWKIIENNQTIKCNCKHSICSAPAVFHSFADIDHRTVYENSSIDLSNLTDHLPGFVLSCTPLEAILQAKLFCLFNSTCLQILLNYFPDVAEVKFFIDFDLLKKKENDVHIYFS